MIQIPVPKPDLSSRVREAIKQDLAGMKRVLDLLPREPDFRTLDGMHRRQLRQVASARIVEHAVSLTEYRNGGPWGPAEVRGVWGFASGAFAEGLYACASIVEALAAGARHRCSYCESRLEIGSDAEVVDHFRPPSGYRDSPGAALTRPGYGWLAYDPSNLVFACPVCARDWKRQVFPVLGERAAHGATDATLVAEEPVLVDVYRENPREIVRFNPRNAQAYPFDRVLSYYRHADPDQSVAQIEARIAADPTRIPLQKDAGGKSISAPGLDEEYSAWLTASGRKAPVRGLANIEILGLNRPTLVRGRASQLRHLRGLFWTEQLASKTPDQGAARQALDAIQSGSAEGAALAPEYVSASIDGLLSFAASGASQRDWIQAYDQLIAAPVRVDVPAYDESLMSVVLGSEQEVAGRRRLVMLDGADRIYGSPGGLYGVFFGIDWSAEGANNLLIQGGAGTEDLGTLAEFAHRDRLDRWRLLANHDVWVIGDYLPYETLKRSLNSTPVGV